MFGVGPCLLGAASGPTAGFGLGDAASAMAGRAILGVAP
ncbi:MAG: hypothetical protein JWO36_4877 [Myxococcales bacterium]|nr:hypothetical protein [Myxococcales bacterium]